MAAASGREKLLLDYYQALAGHFGPCGWWPAETPFEVALGVILTQNTAWSNVGRALDRLREKNAMNPSVLWKMPESELEDAIRPAGYFRVKAVRLKNLLRFLAEQAGLDEPEDDVRLSCLQRLSDEALREALLSVKGIGPESADSIMLYALGRSSFVIDAYTWRLLTRHGLVGEEAGYDEMRDFFMDALPSSVELFNEYHALIVHAGKNFCRKNKPLCAECPLGHLLP